MQWRVFALFMIVVFAITACSPAATQAPTQAPTTPPVAQPTTPPVAQPTTPPAEPTVAPTTATASEFKFGMLLVGPYNDHGWSQATYEGAQYVLNKMGLPATSFDYLDKVNVADRPGTTPDQLAEQLVAKGDKLVFFNSDDMKDGAIAFAKKHPEIYTVFVSGDTEWQEGKNYIALPNMANPMGRMEYMKMVAGCAAALTTKTGQIGFLGPLINDETRRLAASAFLGAKYCWTNYAKKDAASLKFKVTWIGFWFNIPGVTSDPTQVADDFYNTGYDVVISGIDTTEALVEAKKMAGAGKTVWAVPYDFKDACAEAANVCLGVPYFNWGPSFLNIVKPAADGTFKPVFDWVGPDWKDINNPDTSNVGFNKGQALSAEASANIDDLISKMGGGLNLWTGPINLQDGTAYLKDGEVATDQQIWYLPQLLEGMQGQSVSK
jgi:simple sugar transport system substrate-binding protein